MIGRRRRDVTIFCLVGLSALAVIVAPFMGIHWISPMKLLYREDLQYIFLAIRLPRVLTGFFAGGGLAAAGMVYQAIFRNPLACPYTLGVSSGASLGAALCIVLGAGGSVLGLSAVSAGAFIGAIGSIMLICSFAWSKESNSSILLLAGVITGTLCSGVIMFIHYISPLHRSFEILRWTMGGLDGTGYQLLAFLVVPLTGYVALLAIIMPQLDLFLTGDGIAHSRGVNIRSSRNTLIITTAFATGGIVAVCGPVGFVGIIAPHVCRLALPGLRHRLLSALSFCVGGAFLSFSDALARSIAPPSEIPVGIITALVGGPFFLLVLFQKRSRLLM